MHSLLSPFDAAAILVTVAAAFGYVNQRLLGLPSSIGLTVMGAVASIVVVLLDLLLPQAKLSGALSQFLGGVNFHETLLNGMLSFLLFAGALHVDWREMHRGRWPILLLSTVGVLLSTLLVGTGFYWLARTLGLGLPVLWCFVFGALISPTDPVAVMAIMKRAAVAPTLQATVAGESLFNDGVGVVVFTVVAAAAIGGAPLAMQHAGIAFVEEAGGGVLLGLVVGWIGYKAMESIDEYNLELMITLAMVMGGYAIAGWIHVSGPVAMAVAGLLTGNAAVARAMSETCRDHVLKFWALVDELLNAILFLLIGLEVIAVPGDPVVIAAGLAAIPLAIAARAASVWLPMSLLKPLPGLGRQALPTLTWGGLRGGISIALALSLPAGPERTVIIGVTYCIVLFSVIVQGSSIRALLAMLARSDAAARSADSPQEESGGASQHH